MPHIQKKEHPLLEDASSALTLSCRRKQSIEQYLPGDAEEEKLLRAQKLKKKPKKKVTKIALAPAYDAQPGWRANLDLAMGLLD